MELTNADRTTSAFTDFTIQRLSISRKQKRRNCFLHSNYNNNCINV